MSGQAGKNVLCLCCGSASCKFQKDPGCENLLECFDCGADFHPDGSILSHGGNCKLEGGKRNCLSTDCELCQIRDDLFISLCPLHKAAPAMLQALIETRELLKFTNPAKDSIELVQSMIEMAIQKAKGNE